MNQEGSKEVGEFGEGIKLDKMLAFGRGVDCGVFKHPRVRVKGEHGVQSRGQCGVARRFWDCCRLSRRSARRNLRTMEQWVKGVSFQRPEEGRFGPFPRDFPARSLIAKRADQSDRVLAANFSMNPAGPP